MKATFKLSQFRTANVDLDKTISMEVVDSRVPTNSFKADGLTLEEYNERVEFLREHDYIFGMNMVKEKFCS
jgi:hypothetical protein